jgi:hypothetical protein
MKAGSGTGVNVTCTWLPPARVTVGAGVAWKTPATLKNGVKSVPTMPAGATIGVTFVELEKSAIV